MLRCNCNMKYTGRIQKEVDDINENKNDFNIKIINGNDLTKIKIELLSNNKLTMTFPTNYPFTQPIVKLNYYDQVIEFPNYSPQIRFPTIITNVNNLLTQMEVQETINKNIIIEKYNNNVIYILKNKNKDLKIVIGAGNVDRGSTLDYTNFKDNYDAGITNYDMIDKEKNDFLALNLTIDENYATESITTQLKNLCSIVIFDFSVIKFFGNSKCIHMLIDMLIPNVGCLYIDEPFYDITSIINNMNLVRDIQKEFNDNYGNVFMNKIKFLSDINEFKEIITNRNEKVDENNKLYFKNMFKESEYDINFEVINGIYPLHKGMDNGFLQLCYKIMTGNYQTYYKITKVLK